MGNNKKNKLLLMVIIIAFISPIVLSWWLLNYTRITTDGNKSNHGNLLESPRQIENFSLHDPINEKKYRLHGKWSMIYVTDTCDDICINNLYRMRQLHLAMDKYAPRVQRVLLLLNDQGQDLKALFSEYAGQRLLKTENANIDILLNSFGLSKTDNPLTANRLYIIDPLGYLMMSYPYDINPRGIILDLKKLLKNSRIG